MTRSIPLDAAIAEAEKSGFLSIEDLQRLASPQPANPAQVTNAIRGIVEDALNSAIPEPWEVAEHATQRILAALQSQPIAPAGEGLVTEAMVDACANILAQAAGCAAISQQRRNLARMALTAALSKQEPVGRPASVQAAFEVFAGKPDTGPHATALFRYIEQLEASAPKQGAK